MTEKGLKSGKEFSFIDGEGMLQADVSYEKSRSGQMMFKIWFNGTIVKMTKTFKPIQTKVNELIEKYKLTAIVKAENKTLAFEVDLTQKSDVEFGELLEKVGEKHPNSFAEAVKLLANISK